MNKQFTVGIDEVGRGSLAGPVTVAAVAYPRGMRHGFRGLVLKDSKRLTAKQREEWFRYLKNHPNIFYVVAHVQPNVIDRINISQAANLAATRTVQKLVTNYQLPTKSLKVFLDGGLYIDEGLLATYRLPPNTVRTVIRGDQKYARIMLASIIAKCYRDRLMIRKARRFPKYGFERHAGYGTEAHGEVLKRLGPTRLHRLTFIKNFTRIHQYRKQSNRS